MEAEDALSCADALVASIAAERRAVAERFALVAAWADFHCPGWGLPEDVPAPERARDQIVRHLAA